MLVSQQQLYSQRGLEGPPVEKHELSSWGVGWAGWRGWVAGGANNDSVQPRYFSTSLLHLFGRSVCEQDLVNFCPGATDELVCPIIKVLRTYRATGQQASSAEIRCPGHDTAESPSLPYGREKLWHRSHGRHVWMRCASALVLGNTFITAALWRRRDDSTSDCVAARS